MDWIEFFGSTATAVTAGVLTFILTTVPYSLLTRNRHAREQTATQTFQQGSSTASGHSSGNHINNYGQVNGGITQTNIDNRKYSEYTTNINSSDPHSGNSKGESNSTSDTLGMMLGMVLLAIVATCLLVVFHRILLFVTIIAATLMIGITINLTVRTTRVCGVIPKGARSHLIQCAATSALLIFSWICLVTVSWHGISIPTLRQEVRGLPLLDAVEGILDKHDFPAILFAFTLFGGVALSTVLYFTVSWTGLRKWISWLNEVLNPSGSSGEIDTVSADYTSEGIKWSDLMVIGVITLIVVLFSTGLVFRLIDSQTGNL